MIVIIIKGNKMKHINSNLKAPIAKQVAYETENHEIKLSDPYHWLREYPTVTNPEILSYLTSENDYYHQVMDPLKSSEDKIYQEIISRIKLKDQSVPLLRDQYYYYTRTEEDSNHPIICRKHLSLEAKEEILLDINLLSDGANYFRLGSSAVSPDHKKIAYSSDNNGSERFTILVKNIEDNVVLIDKVEEAIGSIIWHKNTCGFFYAKLNKDWRTDKIYYHKLGTDAKDDQLIMSESDQLFTLNVSISNSRDYVFIQSNSKDSNETWYIDLRGDDLTPKLILKRSNDHLYHVDHHDNDFYILTNDLGKNFRLIKAPIADPNNQREVIAHNSDVYLVDLALYQDFYVISAKKNGLDIIEIYDHNAKKIDQVDFPDPTYKASMIFTNYKDRLFRINYSSLNTPNTEFEYNFDTRSKNILKIQEIPSGFDSENYTSLRLFAPGYDGVMVPISLVYNKKLFKKDGSNPLYLYGYGSYGYAVPASFRPNIISLLDRGFVYAIAHIRGGDDLGFKWYEDAKFLTKRNSFEDFMACSKYLISENFTSKQNIVISGGSAGGLLMGVCLNEAADLYRAAILDVPFVDVVNTMMDETLPLTPGEFKEWGNPKDPQYFKYMLSYSPYDNIKAQNYPHILVTAGLNDPRVTYWEPAKWVAKLRNIKTDQNILLLETNMEAGHAGASGRFGLYRDIAKQYNFIFNIFEV
jgi:oligopeptidase B